ncbi:hypothetical protein ACT9XH_07290 [Methanococcoides methylutens]
MIWVVRSENEKLWWYDFGGMSGPGNVRSAGPVVVTCLSHIWS